jgi:cell division protease FtsH
MAGLMGGRVAEEEVFGEPSTGASNDLQQATGLARMMVRDYGMSSTIGPLSLGDDHGPSFLGLKGMEPRNYSDQTALEVDREVQSLVLEAQERARTIVHSLREKLDVVAARLLAVEVVEEEEIERLWGPKAVRPGAVHPEGGHEESPPENPNHPVAVNQSGWPTMPQAAVDVATGEKE